ncbi:MAG: hypothetical protein ABJ205_11070 [Erythrobacter sp.]|uniref:COG3650 family protein n=1 Tax=Erythrobacter sp. TaxID=1042 RepID=UPI003266FF6B
MNLTHLLRTHGFAACAFALVAAGCTDTPGEISRDAAPFDGIAENAIIDVGGTEPFWALRISPEGDAYKAQYSAPELPEGETFSVIRFAGNNGLGFSGEWAGAPVNLTLTPGECSDGMSDRTYPYTATLQLDEVTLFGCAHTDMEPFSEGENRP